MQGRHYIVIECYDHTPIDDVKELAADITATFGLSHDAKTVLVACSDDTIFIPPWMELP